MAKRRRIQGAPKEIMYFFITDFYRAQQTDETLVTAIREGLQVIGISVLEFDTAHGSLGLINESPHEVKLDEIYAVLDGLGIRSNYSRSEFV